MSRTVCAFAAGLSALVFSACASSSSPVSNTTPQPSASAAGPSGTPSAAAVLDPCLVVTVAEASSLTGVAYGPGREDVTPDGMGKLCWYGYQTLNVFEVLVTQAPNATTAQADWDQEKARVQSALTRGVPHASGVSATFNISDTSMTGADRAAVGTFSATLGTAHVNGAGVYLLKGATFLAFTDLTVGQPAPGAAAMEGEAQTALGRLP